MSKYTITIHNQSNTNGQVYLLFQEKPIDNLEDDSTVFTNIFAASPAQDSGPLIKVDFNIQKQYYAVTGTPGSDLGEGVVISTSQGAKVDLAQGGFPPKEGSLVFLSTTQGSPNFKSTSTISTPGGFGIKTDNSFTYPNEKNIFIGLGAVDPADPGSIIPVASIVAKPSNEYILYPKAIYYICTGSYQPGTIVDIKTIGRKLKVDFTGAELTHVTYTQTSNGDYVGFDANSAKLGTMVD